MALQSLHLKQTSELASEEEDGTIRDTGSQSMDFWSPNHMPVAMKKARSFLEKISWLSLEGRAILHQVRRVRWRWLGGGKMCKNISQTDSVPRLAPDWLTVAY